MQFLWYSKHTFLDPMCMKQVVLSWLIVTIQNLFMDFQSLNFIFAILNAGKETKSLHVQLLSFLEIKMVC